MGYGCPIAGSKGHSWPYEMEHIYHAAFSLGESQLDTVRRYILNQEEHHKTKTFVEELDELLKTYNVAHADKRP